MKEVLLGAMTMKTVRGAISEYDLELHKSIEDLQYKFIGLHKKVPVNKNAIAFPPLTMAESD